MRVADVMSSRPVTITPDAPVSEARRLASESGVHHLVITKGRLPVGVVCVRCDLADAVPMRPVSFYMTNPVSIGAYDGIHIGHQALVESDPVLLRCQQFIFCRSTEGIPMGRRSMHAADQGRRHQRRNFLFFQTQAAGISINWAFFIATSNPEMYCSATTDLSG